MARFRSRRIFAFVLALLVAFPPGVRAMEPGAALRFREITLGFEPLFAAFVPGAASLVLGAKAPGGASLVLFDPGAGAEIRRIDLPHSIEDERAGTGSELIVVGDADNRTMLTKADLATGAVRSITLPQRWREPAMARGEDGTVYLADGTSNRINFIPSAAFESPGETAGDAKGKLTYESRGAVRDLAVSADGRFLFVSDTRDARVSALLPDGRVADRIGHDSAKGAAGVSPPLGIMLAGPSPEASGDTALLVGDHEAESLVLTDFQPLFQSFRVVAVASITVPLVPGSVLRPRPGTDAYDAPVLLSANPTQSSIIVGNRFSKRLLFFSRRGAVLERTGEIDLPSPPRSLVMSEDGNMAIAVPAKGRDIVLVEVGGADAGSSNQLPSSGASEDIRIIQRELTGRGYPVGAVDGFAGPRTVKALKALNEDADLDLSIGDISRAARELRALPSRN